MIAVTALSPLVLEPGASADARPFLKEKKSRKYMGVQDELAVVSAGRALAEAGLARALPSEATGLFAAVGYIPFREQDIAPVLAGSLDDQGCFDMRRFAADGYTRAHPLLAFRCLPNMPAFHVAASFGIEGPYFVGYPSAGQLYLALEQAVLALEQGRIEVALVVAVAHQRNLLVEHHFARSEPPVSADALRDAAAALVLERREHAGARGACILGALEDLELRYHPRDALAAGVPDPDEHLGPAAPLLALSDGWRTSARFEHHHAGRDGLAARSRWQRETA